MVETGCTARKYKTEYKPYALQPHRRTDRSNCAMAGRSAYSYYYYSPLLFPYQIVMNLEKLCQQVAAEARNTGFFISTEAKKFDVSKVEHKGFNDLVSYVDK